MKITLSKSQVMELNGIFQYLSNELTDGKPVKRNPYFSYAIARNKDLLKPVVAAIEETQKITLVDYLKEAEDINKTLEGKTDEEKKFIVLSSRPILEEKYKEPLSASTAFLAGTEELDLYTINLSTVGDISAAVMEVLFNLCDPDK